MVTTGGLEAAVISFQSKAHGYSLKYMEPLFLEFMIYPTVSALKVNVWMCVLVRQGYYWAAVYQFNQTFNFVSFFSESTHKVQCVIGVASVICICIYIVQTVESSTIVTITKVWGQSWKASVFPGLTPFPMSTSTPFVSAHFFFLTVHPIVHHF